MIIVRLLSPEPVGWIQHHQLYSSVGADIVMESIALFDLVVECRLDVLGGVAGVWIYGDAPLLQQPFGNVAPIPVLPAPLAQLGGENIRFRREPQRSDLSFEFGCEHWGGRHGFLPQSQMILRPNSFCPLNHAMMPRFAARPATL